MYASENTGKILKIDVCNSLHTWNCYNLPTLSQRWGSFADAVIQENHKIEILTSRYFKNFETGDNVDFSTIQITSKEVRATTLIFRPSKLHPKSTRKWRGNSSKFCLRRIDVISTSNRRGIDALRPLGSRYFKNFQTMKCNKTGKKWKYNWNEQYKHLKHH